MFLLDFLVYISHFISASAFLFFHKWLSHLRAVSLCWR